MNNMNKSLGLLKSMMKKNYKNKHQTMEVNHSNRYSPSKRQKRQIISINKATKGEFNSNIEKKKIIYQQSLQKLDKTNKLKLSQNKKNMEINRYYKNNNILNGNNIPNNFKNRLNNSKTINNLKNKNYNTTSLQKKIGSKSYVDLFQNNVYNSNDPVIPGGGKTISNSIYEKMYDFENENINFNNNANNNLESNSTNDFNNNTFVEEANNIINVLINYINIIKSEYQKLIEEKLKFKEKEIIKLKNQNEFLIKENKNLKYKILEIFYCAKKYYSEKNTNNSKFNFSTKQLLNENLFLRKCININNNINKDYLIKLENEIIEQFKYKELLTQKKILEEEKNNEKSSQKIIAINKEKTENKIDNENNPFKFINENNINNSNNNKINHKRQRTQFKLNNFSDSNKNEGIINNDINEEEQEQIDNINNNNNDNTDSLSNYLNLMNKNILMSRTKNNSQKNLLMNKNNSINNNKKENDIINKDHNDIKPENNNIISNEQSFDSIVHNENKNNALENNDVNNKNEELNKKISGLNNTSSFDKYSQRIEFTK